MVLSHETNPGGVKKIFKFVSGVLNNAFGESEVKKVESEVRLLLPTAPVSLQLTHACDALAVAVTEGKIPSQGQKVLVELLRSDARIPKDSPLHSALGISPLEPAQELFKLVSGVLTGAMSEHDVSTCEQHITFWVPTVDSVGRGCGFHDACDALALAIESGIVPQQSMQMLKMLHNTSENALSDNLCQLLDLRNVETDAGSTTEDGVELASVCEEAIEEAEPVHCGQSAATEEMSPQSIHKLFKQVAGILNGAECDDVGSLPGMCDTLAAAINMDMVPAQGLDTLRGLSEELQNHGLSSSSAIAMALNLDLDKPNRKRAAQRIFTYIRDTLQYKPQAFLRRGKCKLYNCKLQYNTSQGVSISDIVVWNEEATDNSLPAAGQALANIIRDGVMPPGPIQELCALIGSSCDLLGSPLGFSLIPWLCPRCRVNPCQALQCECKGTGKAPCDSCHGSGKYRPACRSCNGTGQATNPRYRHCPSCGGGGQKTVGDCRDCQGHGWVQCVSCELHPEIGAPRPVCIRCAQEALAKAKERRPKPIREEGPPPKGVSIERCNRAELTRLQNLWSERESQQLPGGHHCGGGEVLEAWKVDNPLLAYQFKSRRQKLKDDLNREADRLEGFHGTAPDNVISICSSGFDSGRRCGQVYGAGEYFAKNPHVSVGYCRGGEYMLVCQLTLGKRSSCQENRDGDHIWVPENGYYVIKQPDQVLVQYIIKYTSSNRGAGGLFSTSLEHSLGTTYSTKPPPPVKQPPRPRECVMTRPSTRGLWMGLVSPHIPEEELKKAVRAFMKKQAAAYPIRKLQVLCTHYSKAHIFLEEEMPLSVVKQLNRVPLLVGGASTSVCFDDYYGSPAQKCPKTIAGYCRGHNLRFTQPCWCQHEPRKTECAKYSLKPLPLDGAKGDEIVSKFMASAHHFYSGRPHVTAIRAIQNRTLQKCHDDYREYLRNKHGEEPVCQELYHGTNNNILDVLYTHGLQPPSDMEPSDACPVSGRKGLCTSLCTNSCKHCTRKHEWNRCHMYGLGIYLADMAAKSNRYVSQPKDGKYRMVVCSVLGKSYQVEGHLRGGSCMHDVFDVRAVTTEDMDEMIETCQPCRAPSAGLGAMIVGSDGGKWGKVVSDEDSCWRLSSGRVANKHNEGMRWFWSAESEVSAEAIETAPEKSDLLFIKGLGDRCRPGSSVINSEYIAFHPHQCLPLYEIEYRLD